MFLRQLAAASAEVQPPARWALPDTEETAGHRPRSDSQRRQARTQGPSPSGTSSAGPAVGALLCAMPRRGCSAQRFRGSGSPAPSPCSRSLRGHGLCRVTPAEGTGGDSPRGFIPERGAPPCARCRECRKGVRDRAAAVCSVGCCSGFTARGKKFPPPSPPPLHHVNRLFVLKGLLRALCMAAQQTDWLKGVLGPLFSCAEFCH